MVTKNQLLSKNTRKLFKKTQDTVLIGNPQLKGICLKVYTVKPKKPNSAVRKVSKVLLSTGKSVIAYIPGMGHNLQVNSNIMIRGGRVKDLPGVKYHIIRGRYDFSYNETFNRKKRRSKFSIPKK